ncbi:alanine racemase domain protein [Gloeothece citriformis PCC 7424]|uniref:Pyridoxal phosphate homeostasis protein n=1 Tax=Gloeothece citriformis (strain PCC 7424) TaxID=65393 RepID=B7KEI8_GLOC7|nr:YggS family pyridoxal phosphate-dependent enzyme [Gloeothece citriformis]ACK69013.1 alanine racemase domain protein [Gloeothece citriformis PCC 7424]
MTIAQRINQIRQHLPSHVRLIAVTKQVSPDIMRQAYQAGIRDFGENRLQEALSKQEHLQDLPDICWHFIGHLQTNKAKKVLDSFQWIHSVDSLSLLQRLEGYSVELSNPPQVCLQVKVLPDPNKYGWTIPELLQDLPRIEQCTQVKIQGLMTILPWGLDETETLKAFETTRDLAQELNERSQLQLRELSMGMSGDYHLAIKAGATMIRLGTILFGERLK